jgi:hypothetical protein
MPSFDYSTIKEWLLASVDEDTINTVAEHGIWGGSISALVAKHDVLYFFEFYREEINSKVQEIFYTAYEHRPQDWFTLAKQRKHGNFDIIDLVQAKQFYVGLAVKYTCLCIQQERT